MQKNSLLFIFFIVALSGHGAPLHFLTREKIEIAFEIKKNQHQVIGKWLN